MAEESRKKGPKEKCSKNACKSNKCDKPSPNGKGDRPRNISKRFRENYDGINWGGATDMTKKLDS